MISFYGSAWLLSTPTAEQESGLAATALSLAARGFLGLGVFLVGAVGLSILAFAEDQPRLISFGGVGFRIPARRNQSQPYSQHLRRVAGLLAGILAVLALLVMVQVLVL